MSGISISLERVTVSLNGKKILKDLSWQLRPGEHWAVIGRNGSGKSTLLKLLRGDLWPDPRSTGNRTYAINKRRQKSPVGVKEHISLISPEVQDAYRRNNWDLNGEEVIYTGFFDTAWLFDEPTLEQRDSAGEIIKLLKLRRLIKRSILEMSDGEARKILIARALVSNLQMLFLDEIYSGLDVLSRREIQQLMQRVVACGTQVIQVTHSIDEIIPEITHVLFLKDGRMINRGPRKLMLTSGNISGVLGSNNLPPQSVASARAVSRPQAKKRKGKARELIRISDATVILGGNKALQGLNWRMRADENWAVLGRNGAGKTAFLNLILGNLHPSSRGKIERFGENGAQSKWDVQKRVGYVSSRLQANYDFNLTGSEVICSGIFSTIGLYDEVLQKHWKSVRKIIELLGLGALSKKHIHQMSYGEFRKILIARALVNEPDMLALDDPCSGLDFPSKVNFNDFILNISSLKTRIIMATHDINNMPSSITHVLLMRQGRIVAQGEKEAVLRQYK